MNKATVVLAILALTFLILALNTLGIDAQEEPDIWDKATEIVGKQAVEKEKEAMNQFKTWAQQQLSEAGVPQAIEKGNGRRVRSCVKDRMNPRRCAVRVRTGW